MTDHIKEAESEVDEFSKAFDKGLVEWDGNSAAQAHALIEIAEELHGIREQLHFANIFKNKELSLDWDFEHDPDGKIADALGIKEQKQ